MQYILFIYLLFYFTVIPPLKFLLYKYSPPYSKIITICRNYVIRNGLLIELHQSYEIALLHKDSPQVRGMRHRWPAGESIFWHPSRKIWLCLYQRSTVFLFLESIYMLQILPLRKKNVYIKVIKFLNVVIILIMSLIYWEIWRE